MPGDPRRKRRLQRRQCFCGTAPLPAARRHRPFRGGDLLAGGRAGAARHRRRRRARHGAQPALLRQRDDGRDHPLAAQDRRHRLDGLVRSGEPRRPDPARAVGFRDARLPVARHLP